MTGIDRLLFPAYLRLAGVRAELGNEVVVCITLLSGWLVGGLADWRPSSLGSLGMGLNLAMRGSFFCHSIKRLAGINIDELSTQFQPQLMNYY